MAAGKLDIFIEQGATFSKVITWKDGQENPIDLTGYTARLQCRASTSSADTVFNLTTDNGGIVLGGAIGTITLTISAADTSAATQQSGVYDLELEDASGTVTRLLKGSFIIDPEITR